MGIKIDYKNNKRKVVEFCLELLIGVSLGVNTADFLFDYLVNPLSILAFQELYNRAMMLGLFAIVLWLSVMMFPAIISWSWTTKGPIAVTLYVFLISFSFFTVFKWMIFLLENN